MPHGQVVDECKGTLFIHTPLFPFCLSVVILRSEDYARAGRRPDFSSRCFVLFQSAHPAREVTKSRVPMVISGWGMLFRNPRVVSSSWRMAEMGSNTFNYVPHHFFCFCLLISEPKFFGDKVPVKMLNPSHHSTQKKIVMYHNFFRSRVHPPAADMLAMVRMFVHYV